MSTTLCGTLTLSSLLVARIAEKVQGVGTRRQPVPRPGEPTPGKTDGARPRLGRSRRRRDRRAWRRGGSARAGTGALKVTAASAARENGKAHARLQGWGRRSGSAGPGRLEQDQQKAASPAFGPLGPTNDRVSSTMIGGCQGAVCTAHVTHLTLVGDRNVSFWHITSFLCVAMTALPP